MTVFAILAHSQPQQLARLISRLRTHKCVVHIDRSSDIRGFERALEGAAPTVTWCDERVDVAWGGWSMVDAIAALYRTAARVAAPHEHVVLLSGQCYPLRPVEDLERELTGPGLGKQYCRATSIWENPAIVGRVTKRHFYDAIPPKIGFWRRPAGAARQLLTAVTPDRRLSMRGQGQFFYGSQWTALTRECLDEVVTPGIPRIRRSLRTSLAPDEIAVHTLVHRSRFGTQTLKGGAEEFLGAGTFRLANLHYIDASLKRTFVANDLPELRTSSAFFVRKVDERLSRGLLDRLDFEAAS